MSPGSKVEMTIGYVDQEGYQDKVWIQKTLSVTLDDPRKIPWGPAGTNISEIDRFKLCSELTPKEARQVVRSVFSKYTKAWRGRLET
jgi:hypothetical protein